MRIERAGPRYLLMIDSLGSGGAQRQMVQLFNALRARQVDVYLAWYQPLEHYRALLDDRDPERLIRLPAPGRTPLRTLRAMRRLLRRLRPDAVLSFLTGCSILVGLTRWISPPFRWVVGIRNSRLAEGERPGRLRALLRVIRGADVITANSHAALDELRGWGFAEDRLAYVPNGLPPERIPAEVPDRPAPPIRLLMVGSLRPAKNHVAVVRALCALGALPWELDAVGRHDEYPEHKRDIDAMTLAAGLGDRVRLHGAREDVERFYAQAHLVLQPSLHEGFPNVLLEAWAWRCGVVVSDRGDLPRLVDEGRTGWVVPLDEPDALERVLAAAIQDVAEIAARGRAGHEELCARYTLGPVVDRWIRILDGEA